VYDFIALRFRNRGIRLAIIQAELNRIKGINEGFTNYVNRIIDVIC